MVRYYFHDFRSGQLFYGIIMASSMMIGALLGAQFALKKGVGYVKALFLVVTAILIIKISTILLCSK